MKKIYDKYGTKKIDGLFSVLFNFNHQDAGFFITL